MKCGSATTGDLAISVTTDDLWAVPHARKGMSAAAKAFGIEDELCVSDLRVTIADSTPDNIAVAAFIAVGLLVGTIRDPNSYIDNFIHDGRIRFPETEAQLAEWIPTSV